jgi:nucleotide-binding universal stress UspA family protein
MLKLRTILTPVDFSNRSIAAAEHSVALAERFGSKLIFFHTIPPAPYQYAAFEGGHYTGASWPTGPESRKYFEKQLDALVERVSPRLPVEKVVVEGEPGREIEQMIQDREVDLVVMPTHGYGPFRRFVLGSVTSKVLHDVTCPVFTGAHIEEIPPHDPAPYKHVGCAVDLQPHSEAVLKWAWEFAQAENARLSVIHAVPVIDTGIVVLEQSAPNWSLQLISHARERVEKLLAKTGAKAEVFIESDDVQRYVARVAKENEIDLMVIGRSMDHSIFGRLRTNAYAVIRESPCPVVSV